MSSLRVEADAEPGWFRTGTFKVFGLPFGRCVRSDPVAEQPPAARHSLVAPDGKFVDILYEVVDQVTRITIDRPHASSPEAAEQGWRPPRADRPH